MSEVKAIQFFGESVPFLGKTKVASFFGLAPMRQKNYILPELEPLEPLEFEDFMPLSRRNTLDSLTKRLDSISSLSKRLSLQKSGSVNSISSLHILETTAVRKISTHSIESSRPHFPQRQRSKKLKSLLGDSCPIDISTHQALSHLDNMLSSRLPLSYFLHYLIFTSTCPILFFVLDAIEFQKADFESMDDLYEAARDMFTVYLALKAPLKVSIPFSVKTLVADGIQAHSQSCFASALALNMRDLQELFEDFSVSPICSSMIQDLGHFDVVYSTEQIQNCVSRLTHQLIDAAVQSRTQFFIDENLC